MLEYFENVLTSAIMYLQIPLHFFIGIIHCSITGQTGGTIK
jgi:hypothetical protein